MCVSGYETVKQVPNTFVKIEKLIQFQGWTKFTMFIKTLTKTPKHILIKYLY